MKSKFRRGQVYIEIGTATKASLEISPIESISEVPSIPSYSDMLSNVCNAFLPHSVHTVDQVE